MCFSKYRIIFIMNLIYLSFMSIHYTCVHYIFLKKTTRVYINLDYMYHCIEKYGTHMVAKKKMKAKKDKEKS